MFVGFADVDQHGAVAHEARPPGSAEIAFILFIPVFARRGRLGAVDVLEQSQQSRFASGSAMR